MGLSPPEQKRKSQIEAVIAVADRGWIKHEQALKELVELGALPASLKPSK
jgi:hypothetical protein